MITRNATGLIIGAFVLLLLLTGTTLGHCTKSEGGSLTIIEPDGKPSEGCPLEHTSVSAEVSGFVARVSVKQIFHNPRDNKIEAVYTFPLSATGAVDEMLMKVGDRVVKGKIKKREEARRIYNEARQKGHVASLLDQERPNIFTQSVANIMPGEKVEITIKYVEILPYDDGAFKFVFPMVVGPRFIPGAPTGSKGTGWAKDTDQVPDASKITPPVADEGTRAGHDIDLTVKIDAGVPILKVESKLHEVDAQTSGSTATVSLKDKKTIPNKDFVLKYHVAGDKVKSGVLTHRDGKEGFVTVIMIPPKRVKPSQVAPKEMIFVIDCSGSQRGRPLQKAKETMKYVIDNMNPDDTFNIIDFNVNARMLFSEPKKNTPDTRFKAHNYINSLQARGGTWMGPAVEEVCKKPPPENRLRIVTFMTDGYVGNDFEIISLVKRLRGESRWFPFGTGNSVNRFLLDNMARVGGGEVEYILLNSPGEEVAKKFYERIASPVLTDLKVSYEGIKLEDVYPQAVADLWDRKPLVFKARYEQAGKGKIVISGFSGGKPYEQILNVTLPEKEKANPALASLWARAKVDDLMDQDWMGAQSGNPDKTIKDEIVKVALKHRIMTRYTSFVAVDESKVTKGGEPEKVAVPVEMPDGVSREGVFGDKMPTSRRKAGAPGRAGWSHKMEGTAPSGAQQALSRQRLKEGHGVVRGMKQISEVRTDSGKKQPRAVYVKDNYVKKQRPGSGMVPTAPPPPVTVKTKEHETREEEPAALTPADTERDSSADIKDAPQEAGKPERAGESKIEGVRTAALQQKLAPALLEVIKKKGDRPDYTVGTVSVKDGKVTVKVRLSKLDDTILKKLEEAGLKIADKKTANKTVTGTIEIGKLKDLAKLAEVLRIEPLPAG
jgi:Ca-activated chloride channel family protein